MNTSTHPNQDLAVDVAHEIALLRRQLNLLLKRLSRQKDPSSDYSIDEWCAKHAVSRAGYYLMRKEGRGPRVLENGGLRRITHAADEEWEARWASGVKTTGSAD